MIGWLIKKADKWNGVEEFVFSPLHNTSKGFLLQVRMHGGFL
jgi:hypothetical protein